MEGTTRALSVVRTDIVRLGSRSLKRLNDVYELTDDASELRAVGIRGSGLAAKTSLSNLSASALLTVGRPPGFGVAAGSVRSGRKGSPMLDRTSWSSSPSISISCIFARATNLEKIFEHRPNNESGDLPVFAER